MFFRNLVFSLGLFSSINSLTYHFINKSTLSRRLISKSSFLMAKELPKSESGWRTVLSPYQFKVLREKATEPPGYSETNPGELEYELKKKVGTKYPKEGVFNCVACDSPLYYAKTKFDSGCGWPAFYEGVPGAIKEVPDADGRRVEIVCSNCGSHLGHVFKNEGFPTPTNERYHCETYQYFIAPIKLSHSQALCERNMPQVRTNSEALINEFSCFSIKLFKCILMKKVFPFLTVFLPKLNTPSANHSVQQKKIHV